MKFLNKMMNISWYRTSFGESEIEAVGDAIKNEHISLGSITQTLEEKIASELNIKHAVITTSGSVALLMSMMALDIKNGDEVIIPNRTWIATAHSPMILGARVRLVDVTKDLPLMDISQIEKMITDKTKAVIPVHLNGRSVDMNRLNSLAKNYNLKVVEDACQALFSKNSDGYLGTQSNIGFFSLGVTKIISTCQGGIAVTNNSDLYERLKLIRNHGTTSVLTPQYMMLGCNFKFTDIQSSIGLVQLSKKEERIEHLKKIYNKYESALKDNPDIIMIPVDLENGEVPLYIEVLCRERDRVYNYLKSKNIDSRVFLPDIDKTSYISSSGNFPNSRTFSEHGLFLPCGPTQSLENVDYVIQSLRNYQKIQK